jgi:hypothetical protein
MLQIPSHKTSNGLSRIRAVVRVRRSDTSFHHIVVRTKPGTKYRRRLHRSYSFRRQDDEEFSSPISLLDASKIYFHLHSILVFRINPNVITPYPFCCPLQTVLQDFSDPNFASFSCFLQPSYFFRPLLPNDLTAPLVAPQLWNP